MLIPKKDATLFFNYDPRLLYREQFILHADAISEESARYNVTVKNRQQFVIINN